MATRRNPTVVDADGERGRIREVTGARGRSATIVVELTSGARISLPSELLHPHADGGYSIEGRWRELAGAHTELEIPVRQEEVVVGARMVPGERVRVRRRVVTEDRVVETPIWRERIEVRRIPRGDFVERPPAARCEGDTLIVPSVEEVAVIEKRLRLVEEFRIRVIRERHIERRTVPLKRFEVEIEREDPSSDQQSSPSHEKKHQGGSS